MGLTGDTFLGMRAAHAFDHPDMMMLDALFDCAEEPLPLVNIIHRLHGKEDMFNVMNDSVYFQDYENINQIYGSDIDCFYVEEYIPLTLEEPKWFPIPAGHYYAPYNLHMNTLIKEVEDGWQIALDEDDLFLTNSAVSTIVKHITSEDDIVFWRVRILPNWIVPSEDAFGKRIEFGNISGIGFMYHSKHNDVVDWGNISGGDYRVIMQLINKGLKPVYINEVLTGTQSGPHSGK